MTPEELYTSKYENCNRRQLVTKDGVLTYICLLQLVNFHETLAPFNTPINYQTCNAETCPMIYWIT